MPSADHLPYFIPAQTMDEAVSRIFGLTGGLPRNRGEKRALIALRDALELDVDVVRTNAVLGRRLAETLDVEWIPEEHTVRNKVTLAGLNVLLEAAAEAYHDGALKQVSRSAPRALEGPMWKAFRPAVSKIEAVTRIAGLTGAPDEWLGPGSKEHKTVLTNLADRLMPQASLDRSTKTRLAASIAAELGVRWTDSCYSTGETISLEGLNTILAGAERQLGRLGSNAAELLGTPEAEGRALVAALHDGWRAERWDAKKKIEWMHARSARGHNDNEWQGFYFEAHGREILNAAFPPSLSSVKVRYCNTTFDYSLNYVWDLKAHTEQQYFPVSDRFVRGGSETLLNDEEAIRRCVAEQGLGFLIMGGQAVMDENLDFVAWHREFKRIQGVRSAVSNSGRSRLRKSAFVPLYVDAFWVANTDKLRAAVAAGQLVLKTQGRQAPTQGGGDGATRRTKFALNVDLARSTLAVGRRDWKH